MAGLYIHIPFCAQLCSYCDFHFSLSLKHIDAMVESMISEMTLRRDYLKGANITSLYFGGGTPSLLSLEQLARLISHAEQVFGFKVSELGERTIECNPEDLAKPYLEGLLGLGFNRLSIGVQSLDDEVLRFMNRRHTASRAVNVVKEAQGVGFKNISVDLIFGVPDAKEDSLKKSVEGVLAMGVGHISAYHLTVEEKTVLGVKARKGLFAPVVEDISGVEYQYVENCLTGAGYEHYEVSNYALGGFKAVHNSSYWSGEPYLGIGASAHSFDGVSRQWNVAGNARYIKALNSSSAFFEREDLSPAELYNEYTMTSLRTAKGLDLNVVESRWGKESVDYLLCEGESLLASGKLHREGSRLFIATSDFLVSDMIITDLMK